MTKILSLALAATALSATVAFANPGQNRPSFDGQWSVLIVTQKGDCDRGYRYPVQITNGAVGYAGQASFNVGGRVSPTGAITVTVSRGDKSARGNGTLSGREGSGFWKTSGGECSGTWTAERRI
ncbi:MAG: hypothetical protein AB7K04_10880 [Pseudorhodoplanes sp.]